MLGVPGQPQQAEPPGKPAGSLHKALVECRGRSSPAAAPAGSLHKALVECGGRSSPAAAPAGSLHEALVDPTSNAANAECSSCHGVERL